MGTAFLPSRTGRSPRRPSWRCRPSGPVPTGPAAGPGAVHPAVGGVMVDLIRSSPSRGLRSASDPARREPTWHRVDWVLAVTAIALSLIGAVLVWAATRQHQIDLHADPQYYL